MDNNIYNTRKFGDFYLDIPLKTEKYPINIYPKIYNIKGLIVIEFRLKKKDEGNYLIYEEKEEQSEDQLKIKENNNIIVDIKENNTNQKELKDMINNMQKINFRTVELMNMIDQKNNELKELKSFLPFEIKKGEKLMNIIITSHDQKITCPILCKNTEIFNNIENLLYEKYPQYKEIDNFFIVNGNKINKNKNLEENKINNNEIITLIPSDY